MKTFNLIRLAITLACAVGVVTEASAQRYLTNSGPWTTANNWTPVGVPSGADTRVGQGAAGTLKTGTVTISAGDNVTASTLYLGVDGSDTHGTVDISGGTLTISGSLVNGFAGTGTVVQTGGRVEANDVRLGETGSAHGNYQLSGSDSFLKANNIYVGTLGTLNSTNYFTMSSGTISNASTFHVAYRGIGSFTQTGGTNVTHDFRMNQDAANTASLTVSGANTLLKANGLFITCGSANSTSTVIHSGGTIQVGSHYQPAYNGVSTITQSGGQLIVGGEFRANDNGGTLTYNLSGASTQLKVTSHFYTALNGASAATIVHSGGTIEVGGNYQPSWQGNSTITQSGGQLLVAGQFRMGENGNTTYNLSGGQIFVSGANSYIGLFNGSKTSTMNQSGGTATFQTLQIGINQTANYNLTGGQLNALQLDKASSGSLNLSGGTLTAGTITFNVSNGGSTISPGTNNFTGRTSISGTLGISSGTLALKIGGTTAATAYQDTVSKFANVTATGAITLGGNLKPTLINSFTPGASDTFTIMSGSSVSGTFGNTATANGGGVRVVLADGLSSFKVNYNPTTVVLANYMGDNEWQGSSGANWGAASAASWTALDPNGSAYIAKFADAPGGSGALTANLDANRTVQGILFTSANRHYTISGANTLTFDNTGNNAPAFITASGTSRTNTISTAVVLNSDLNVTNSLPETLLTMSGNISGSGRALTKSGSGTLVLSGNTYSGGTVINGGRISLTGTLASGVTVNSGGTLQGSGRVNGTISGRFLNPGASPGILTASQFDPTGGADAGFEFTATGDPTWSNAGASVNDVLRLTHSTTPFTANLDSSNTLDIYFNVATLAAGNTFRGGFFTDRNSDFTLAVDNAAYNFYVFGDGGGSIVFNGVNYYTLAQYNANNSTAWGITRSVVQVPSANFSGGTILNGWVQQFQILDTASVVPEPSTVFLLGVGAAMLYRRLRRNRTA